MRGGGTTFTGARDAERSVARNAENGDNAKEQKQPKRGRTDMSTDLNAAKSAESRPRLYIGPSGAKALQIYEKEIATYVRELPRLLQEGQTGRHALIKGDEILSIWDTQGDAIQAGREKFGLDPICVKTIDEADIGRFALLEEWKKSQYPS